MDPDEGHFRQFVISSREIQRRAAAFDRLAVTTTAATAVFAVDSIAVSITAFGLGLLALALVFLACRAALARSFGRFGRTTWTVTATALVRTDERSRDEYPLTSLRRVRTKRTKAGGIREIRIDLGGRRSVYVNGLEDFEAFREALLSGSPQVDAGGELREIIDFDHPLFYVFVGVAFGLSIASLVRLARSGSDGRYVYVALAAYSLGLGAYWLVAKPVSGRYGERSVALDYLIGFGLICVGAAALVALLWR